MARYGRSPEGKKVVTTQNRTLNGSVTQISLDRATRRSTIMAIRADVLAVQLEPISGKKAIRRAMRVLSEANQWVAWQSSEDAELKDNIWVPVKLDNVEELVVIPPKRRVI